MIKNDSDLCPQCEVNSASKEKHPCPFEVVVNNNTEDYCNCCEDCTQNCDNEI